MQVSSKKNFNLLQSVEKHNFSKAKQEWVYYGMVDNKLTVIYVAMKEFNWHELQFVGQFMSSQQRERYNIILK